MKKFISVLAAAIMICSFATFGAYAENPDDPEDIVPIDVEEDEEDPEPDVDDVELIDSEPSEPNDSENADPEDTEPDMVIPEDTTAPAPEEETAAPVAVPDYIKVDQYTMYATEVVNVRYGPDTSYSKFGTVYANSPVTVVGYSGGWLAIQYNGSTGFVSASFFSQTAPETTTTAAATTAAAEPTETETETEPHEARIDDTLPPETTAPDEAAETTKKTKKPKKTEPAETTKDETAAAAVTDNDSNNNGGGLTGILIALGCAVGTFLLVGVIPVVIHRICHNKLYQY